MCADANEIRWHDWLVESLEMACDHAAQRAGWVDATRFFPPPVEVICGIFDDSAIMDLLARGPVFSELTDASLRSLDTLAEAVDVDLHPKVLLASAAWLAFTREAERALALLRDDLEPSLAT